MSPKRMPSKGPSRAQEGRAARRLVWTRLARTVILGAAAAVAAIFWVGAQYGVEPATTLKFLSSSVVFVTALIFAGLGAVLLLTLAKRYIKSLKKRSRRGR